MGFVAVGSCGWLGVMVGMVVVGVEGHVPTCAVRVFDRILAWVIKILDQLQDPRKEVIKLLSDGQTLRVISCLREGIPGRLPLSMRVTVF